MPHRTKPTGCAAIHERLVVRALRELHALGIAYPQSVDVAAQLGWTRSFARRALTLARRAGSVRRHEKRCGWRTWAAPAQEAQSA